MIRSGPAIAAFFTAAIFTSAALLFFVQPMYAKLVLPLLGGSAAVWTTAMLFFQSALLAGYLYAHLSTRYLPVTAQVALHLALWALAFVFLPLAIPQDWTYSPDAPAAWQTLEVFALGVGVPFAVLSGNAPLIQSWYARSGGPSAEDPYFLYGASNAGSLIALLGFPLVAAPLAGAQAISLGWAWVYGLLGILLLGSGLLALRNLRRVPPGNTTGTATPLTARQIGLWLFLAFVPSSLMLATTETIATDIGSFPLVWVIPLALYLLTFVLAFSNRTTPRVATLQKLYLLALILIVTLMAYDQVARLGWVSFAALIAFFFAATLLAHRRLYESRPDERHLTIFYFTMSVGGAMGGMFNSILAPVIFNDVYEGPVVVALSGMLLMSRLRRPTPREIAVGLAVAALAALPMLLRRQAIVPDQNVATLLGGIVVALGLIYLGARAFGTLAAVAALLVIGHLASPFTVLHKERSFFGTYKVRQGPVIRNLLHGTTAHGAQFVADTQGPPQPLAYYHRNGPMGQLFTSATGQQAGRIGVVGLGVGALACYGRDGQDWQFYEIDAAIDRIARDPALFGFMENCAGDAPTHIGDARLVLETEVARSAPGYDILVIDAYSSDSVPVHLVTLEAMQIYRARLAEGGILAFHISNRYFDLAPVLGRAADSLAMTALLQKHPHAGAALDRGDTPTHLVLMSADPDRLAPFAGEARWQALAGDGGTAWTDDFANILGALR